MTIIVDATVAAEWAVPKAGTAEAIRLLEQGDLAAPAFWLADALAPDDVAPAPEMARHLARAGPRRLQERLVDQPHEREVLRGLADRPVVE